jgi:demethylmenaquinone methyltransferase/2-methoxy-6-polyprenyl-1,4-benzoquinol methylase
MEYSSKKIPPHPPLHAYFESQTGRQRFLSGLFDDTASYYSLAEHAGSFGLGRWHRRKALQEAGLSKGMRVLDVACGPGLVTQCAAQIVGPSGYVVGLDPSVGMLHEARKGPFPHCVQGMAEHLPFRDASFDFLSMGYALRHVSDLTVAFREYLRVLRPGGIVLALEISRPTSAVLMYLVPLYLKSILGTAFATATGNRQMYTLMAYLWDTIEQCVPPATILEAFKNVGFTDSTVSEWCSGLLRDYRAVKV